MSTVFRTFCWLAWTRSRVMVPVLILGLHSYLSEMCLHDKMTACQCPATFQFHSETPEVLFERIRERVLVPQAVVVRANRIWGDWESLTLITNHTIFVYLPPLHPVVLFGEDEVRFVHVYEIGIEAHADSVNNLEGIWWWTKTNQSAEGVCLSELPTVVCMDSHSYNKYICCLLRGCETTCIGQTH